MRKNLSTCTCTCVSTVNIEVLMQLRFYNLYDTNYITYTSISVVYKEYSEKQWKQKPFK